MGPGAGCGHGVADDRLPESASEQVAGVLGGLPSRGTIVCGRLYEPVEACPAGSRTEHRLADRTASRKGPSSERQIASRLASGMRLESVGGGRAG